VPLRREKNEEKITFSLKYLHNWQEQKKPGNALPIKNLIAAKDSLH